MIHYKRNTLENMLLNWPNAIPATEQFTKLVEGGLTEEAAARIVLLKSKKILEAKLIELTHDVS